METLTDTLPELCRAAASGILLALALAMIGSFLAMLYRG